MHERSIPASRCTGVWVSEQLTFVSDEVSAQDDEQAEEDEDDNGHHPSDHGVVHTRGGRHGRGVLRKDSRGLGEAVRVGEEREREKGTEVPYHE